VTTTDAANPDWPARGVLAVNVVINFEEGAELSQAAGDADSEAMSEPVLASGSRERDLMTESVYEYGSRRGIWRVLDALAVDDIPATVFACGRAVEVLPQITAALVARGFDFVGHGYRWTPSLSMNEDEIRADIRRTRAVIERATGTSMLGWFSRSPVGPLTRTVAAEEGLLYDSMTFADDAPMFTKVNGRPFLTVPYTSDVNDIRFWRGNLFSGDEFAEYGRSTFDELYSERDQVAQMMSIGVHPRIIGRPGRIGGLVALLEHIRSHTDVWLTRRSDIALSWIQNRTDDARQAGT
jgi:allantoinase